MKTLVELTVESKTIAEKLIENGGELTEELEHELNVNATELSLKVDSYKFVLDELGLKAEFWKNLKSQVVNAERSAKRASENLKDRLKYSMKLTGASELSGTVFRAKKSRGKPKVRILDEESLPGSYLRERVILEPDKEKILNDLLEGKQVDGCVLEEVETLRFYTSKG